MAFKTRQVFHGHPPGDTNIVAKHNEELDPGHEKDLDPEESDEFYEKCVDDMLDEDEDDCEGDNDEEDDGDDCSGDEEDDMEEDLSFDDDSLDEPLDEDNEKPMDEDDEDDPLEGDDEEPERKLKKNPDDEDDDDSIMHRYYNPRHRGMNPKKGGWTSSPEDISIQNMDYKFRHEDLKGFIDTQKLIYIAKRIYKMWLKIMEHGGEQYLGHSFHVFNYNIGAINDELSSRGEPVNDDGYFEDKEDNPCHRGMNPSKRKKKSRGTVSILFSKNHFSKSEAEAWLQSHNYRSVVYDNGGAYYNAPQMKKEDQAKYRDQIRTKELKTPGVLIRFVPVDAIKE